MNTSTPSAAAMAAAKDIIKTDFPLTNEGGTWNRMLTIDYATTIDRHFAPLHEELAQWKQRAFAQADSYAGAIDTITTLRESNDKLQAELVQTKELWINETRAASEATIELEDLREEVVRLKQRQPINTHIRLFDLVRYMRSELHDADLITSEEYVWLSGEAPMAISDNGSPSPRRLEDYDELRKDTDRLDTLESLISQGTCVILKIDGIREKNHFTIVDANGSHGDHPTVRGAIDSLGTPGSRPSL